MLKEKSAGIVLFRGEGKKRMYLLLYKPDSLGYNESWDFPKGWIEKHETEAEAAAREAKEEAGIIKLRIIPKFKETVVYFYKNNKGKLVHKTVIWFLAETKQEKAKVSWEHKSYKWFSYEEAVKTATFRTTKQIIKKAEEFLS